MKQLFLKIPLWYWFIWIVGCMMYDDRVQLILFVFECY